MLTVDKTSELKIDKDCFVDGAWVNYYVQVIVSTCQSFRVKVESIRMCNSRKKGLHLYIKISPPIEPSKANMLQWLLGDDSARVDFNRARIESGLEEWNKLFEIAGRRLKTIYTANGRITS
jgi:hypothetical protein